MAQNFDSDTYRYRWVILEDVGDATRTIIRDEIFKEMQFKNILYNQNA